MNRKNKMKRILASVLSVSMMLCAAGCGNQENTNETTTAAENTAAAAKTDEKSSKADNNDEKSSKKLSVVCTIFPEYDWVKEIVGGNDNVEITYLLDNGVDLHSYQPTAADIAKISSCDLFVYVGGESDEWVEGALAEATNKDMRVINLMEVMGDKAKVEELKEGMQGHDHDHEHAEIEESGIKDRELSDFEGSWQSLYPFLEAGELEAYVKDHAEEHGEPEDEVREELAEKWGCDLNAVSVDGSKIDFTFADGTTKSGEYKYAGYTPVLADDGDIHAVRYQYEAVSGDSPKYVVFNDHGYEPGKAEHFHIYYGDGADIETALADFTYNPFFIPADLNGEEALEVLNGHDHGKSEEHEHEHEHEEGEEEYDEHVWLSLRNAEVLCAEIENNLSAADPANADSYKANLTAYVSKLDSLDNDFKTLIESAGDTTLIFGDRFPFRYFTDDYGVDYYAAFVGCSAETEASFETITFLAGKADELGSDTIYTIENSDGRIAQSIIGATKAKNMNIAVMNSVQSVSKEQIESGTTYLSLMQQNYDVLKADLG